MRKNKQVICVTLSLILLLLAFWPSSIANATELTNDSIKAKEAEIASAQAEKKELQNSVSDIKRMKKELEKSKANLSDYITELDAKVADIQENIEKLAGEIEVKEKEIKETQAELEEAIKTQEAQYEAMKKRIKFMYEKGDTLYVDMLMEAGSFGDALNKAEYIESLSAYDRKMLDQYVAYSEYVSVCKKALEEQKGVLDEAKKSQEAEEKSINELIGEKESEIAGLSADISDKESAIKEYEAYIAEQDSAIKALEAAVAEEKKKLAEEQARKYDGGMFAHPCPGYVRISDDFGYRMHPTLGVQKMHNGVDFAAKAGTPILAAYNGEVVASAYSSSMGNYIMIDHGGGLYTIYMHASALYVSKGQEVSRGQKIAAVGTTGRSTGNHLHFGVRLNGSYVSPWNYIG